MAQGRSFRKKIKSAKNIAKITRAMQMVAASKMKRAQESALAGRPYAEGLLSIAGLLSNYLDPSFHALLANPQGKNLGELTVLIAPEKGLCGAMITNLIKKFSSIQKEIPATSEFIVIGKKAKYIASKLGGKIIAEFNVGVSQPSYDLIPIVTRVVRDRFLSGEIGKVHVYYSKFVNTMAQEPQFATILPLTVPSETESQKAPGVAGNSHFVFEPNPQDVTESLLNRYLETEIYHFILESYASEQSARMVAMKNATDNAQGLIEDLTVQYNKARQTSITAEIADIASASVAFA